jgi:hypothetical protein
LRHQAAQVSRPLHRRLPRCYAINVASLDAAPSHQPRCRPRLWPRRCRQCPRRRPRPRHTIPDPVAPTPLPIPPLPSMPLEVPLSSSPTLIAIPDHVAPSPTSKVSSLSSSPLMAGEARPTQAPCGRGCRLCRSNKLSLALSVMFSVARGVLVYCYLYKIVACS